MKKFIKCTKAFGIVLLSGMITVTAGGCGSLAKVSEQIANGDFIPDSENLENWIWNEEWGTYDVSDMTIFNEDFPVIKDEESYEEAVAAADIQNLELALGGCEVTIEASPDADYHVKAEKISAFQTYTEESTLYVRGLQRGSGNISMKIILQIPADTVYSRVVMSFGAGDFSVQSFAADIVEVEVGAGRLQIDGLQAGSLDVKLGAGQTIIKNAEVLTKAELETGMGEMIFEGSIPGDLQAECAMGNMEIKITGSTESGHNYNLECAAGNLTAGSQKISEGLGEKEIDNGAASDYELKCAMGNLSLTFE